MKKTHVTRAAGAVLLAVCGVVAVASGAGAKPPITTVYRNITNDHSGKCVTVC
jgi:hypothetical protein